MNFVHEKLLNYRYNCRKCNSKNAIDWLKDRGANMGSIPSKNPDYTFIKAAASEVCPICNTINFIPLPVVKKRFEFLLFGDEASRELSKNSQLFTYSLVGSEKRFMPNIEQRLKEIKAKLLPIDPDAWKIHMRELWSGDIRRKHKYFKDLTLNNIKSLLDDIESLFNDFGEKIYKVNILYSTKWKNEAEKKFLTKKIKEESYICMVLAVINILTGQGGEPIFIFDADKKVEADIAIQEWAANAFSKGCNRMLYSFMSHSILIREPIFVKPASKPLLELADVLSFVVARYNLKLYLNENPDIDCSMFGKVDYFLFVNNGNQIINHVGTSYPWNIYR